jgi:hypothetical protein
LPLLGALGIGVLVCLPGFVRATIREGASSRPATWVIAYMRLTNPLATPSSAHIRRRLRRALLTGAWAVPLAALLAASIPADSALGRGPFIRGLISRCRFLAVPTDDIERLAVWCRDHTPATARFIGPPGPKTFRLWSRRSLAFNRSASPYHAAGLADWFARFQDHVAFHGPAADFVQGYVNDRHGFESRYDRLSDSERAALALRQGADYVVTLAPKRVDGRPRAQDIESPLELLHVEGRYAVSRVRSAQVAQRQQ